MDNTVDTASLPWIPLGPGESFKPLRFYRDDRGRVLLLRPSYLRSDLNPTRISSVSNAGCSQAAK
jgi:hypothetical protein